MKTLKLSETKSIEQFFQLTQDNLLKIMGRYLKSKYEHVYFTQDYIVAIGDIPVALVAHLDTVFPSPPENIFYDRVKNVMWSPDGLGADDRAGVYAIVQLLKRGLKPTIIFTTDEEKGALGAEKLVTEHPEPLAHLHYIIQLDRRGSNDCVFYDCDNSKFEEYVERFGFVTAYGTFTDISVICPAWGIAGVNLSVGYVDEHSYSELLYIGNMMATIEKVATMLKDAENLTEGFEYIPSAYAKYYSFTSNVGDDFGWDPSYGISKDLWRSWLNPKDTMPCNKCGVYDYDYNLFPTKDIGGNTTFLCADCISEARDVRWCPCCGEPYKVKDEIDETPLCYDCRKEEANA